LFVTGLAFSRDGQNLAGGLQDGTVLVWELKNLEAGRDAK
jgi:WD40 repeat protein